MYHFYGIIGRSASRLDQVHRQSVNTLRRKFPARAAGFDLIHRDGLLLFGAHIRSCRVGDIELFLMGELYNEGELPCGARSSSGAEGAILDLYIRQGESGLSRLNGSFVLLFLDHAAGSCRIVNDQLGNRQVFYHDAKDYVLFGSELKYLFCHPSCPREIDWTESLKRPIPFIVVNPERRQSAWFKGIRLLEEGSVLEYAQQRIQSIRPYWNPWTDPDVARSDSGIAKDDRALDEWADAYLALLDDAVRIRCDSPGQSFSMFSGGMDSTIIAALARRYGDVGTFSFATEATVRDGATGMCVRLAEDLGLSNTQVVLSFDRLVRDGRTWQKQIWSAESPFAHKDAIGKMILHAAISGIQPDVRHIMSGTGSDQVNGGLVRWFVEDAEEGQDDANWHRVMEELRTEMLKPVIGHQHDPFWGSRDLLHTGFLSSLGRGPVSDYPWAEFMRGCLHANQFVLVWDELRVGDWHHRGVRFPFMDHRFVPFMLGIPRALHSRLFFDKQILRRGARAILPSYLNERPKAPVFKPGEDQRIPSYTSILFGRDGLVLDQLLQAISAGGHPVDPEKFQAKAMRLAGQPDTAGWAYLMHVAGLVTLSRLPELDEADIDFHADVMGQVDVVRSTDPAILSRIRRKLGVPSPEEFLDMPLAFGQDCSLVADVSSGAHFLVRDGELRYALADDQPAWRSFLLAVDGIRSARSICVDNQIDLSDIEAYLRTCLDDSILCTLKTPADHATA